VPYFTLVLLAASRVDQPITALESLTVSATGPLLIWSELPDWELIELLCIELELLLEGVVPFWEEPLELLASDCGKPASNPLLPAFGAVVPFSAEPLL
jgi:hypothetical protein